MYHNRWAKDNPEKFNKMMNNYYHKNKDKHICRCMTYDILVSKGQLCKSCGINQNLRIHHEVYHTTAKEIREDILQGKIYFLCKECHRGKHL